MGLKELLMRLVLQYLSNFHAVCERFHTFGRQCFLSFFTHLVMEPIMAKKYAHLVHDDNVVYLRGCGPSNFQYSAERELARASEAARIRSCGHRPFIVAGLDRPGPKARAELYSLPPRGSIGDYW